MIFGYWTSIISMALIAVSPATVLASERIWADTLLAALVTLTFLFLLYYLRSQRLIFLILSATGYGLALLTKNTALLLGPALLLAAIYFSNRNGGGRKSSLFIMVIFSILVLILTAPWYYCVYKTFGTPLFDPKQEGISKVYFWWAFQKSRPWYTYLVSIPTMVPLFLLGYYRVVGLLRQRKLSSEVLLGVWFLSFFISIILITQFSEMLGPDSRYMLPAYPPLAILAASQIMRFKGWLASRFSASVARFAIIASLIICGAWSYSLSDPAYAQFPQMYKHFMNMPW
jgi:4-amino-4-deoxy-L-arabinose transferase-like glycosyltransferase